MLEEEAQQQDAMVKGRQIAWKLYQRFKLSEAEGAILEFGDLLEVKLKGDNLRGFLNAWEFTLLSLKQMPSDAIVAVVSDWVCSGRCHLCFGPRAGG